MDSVTAKRIVEQSEDGVFRDDHWVYVTIAEKL